MQSVQSLIREEFHRNPLILELLSKNLLNTGELAKNLKPKFEETLQKEISTNTIIVSIARLKKNIEKESRIRAVKISGSYPVFWHYFKFKSHKKLLEFLSEVDISKEDLCLFKNNKLTIISKNKEKGLLDLGENNGILDQNIMSDLCEIKVEFPPIYNQEVGLFYRITTLLYWQNHPIIDIRMISNKIYIYLQEENFSQILSVLRSEFSDSVEE